MAALFASLWLISLAALATPAPASADAVTLESGEVVRGFVVLEGRDAARGSVSLSESGPDFLVLDPTCGERRIPRALVRKISRLARPPGWNHGCAARPRGAARLSYGSHTFLVDASFIGLGIAAGSIANADITAARILGGIAAAGYLLGPPIVHLLHRQGGAAGGSFALRLGAPLGGALLGGAVGAKAGSGYAGYVGIFVGAALGIVTAAIVDAAVLAEEEVESAPAVPSAFVLPAPARNGTGAAFALSWRF